MAEYVIKGRKNNRVSRNLALHVLEIMLACKKSEEEKTYYNRRTPSELYLSERYSEI